MNALKTRSDLKEVRNFNLDDAAAYIGLGRNSTRQLMDQIGATIRIGRRVLFSKPVIDRYFESMNQAAGQEK